MAKVALFWVKNAGERRSRGAPRPFYYQLTALTGKNDIIQKRLQLLERDPKIKRNKSK